ncbi:MAG: xanthine dehydrogenase family protein molybdopterin-binding subunit, partial [Acidobacteria bacterium]|nr:xanthine dehydrogenase family protein molybdopterin-binding subunit [Acidobacteriota bacterium]
MSPAVKYVGQKVLRKEDPRLLTGKGQYVDDIHLPNTAHLALLRSPYAHARIQRLDATQARALPGVLAVLTGPDLRGQLGPVPAVPLPDLRIPDHPLLALDRVRYVGEPLAAVAAETPYIARDALDQIEVDYEPLPAVVDPEIKTLEKGSAVIHEGRSDNIAATFRWVSGDIEGAFRKADRVVQARLVNQRLAPVAMEGRAVQASYQAGEGFLTLWSATQIPHLLRAELAQMLSLPDNRIRVI